MPSTKSTPPSREAVDQIRVDVIKAMALRVELELRVSTPLENDPLTANELANSLGLKLRRLEMLPYQMVASGFLELHGNQIANTPMTAHYFIWCEYSIFEKFPGSNSNSRHAAFEHKV